MSKLIVNEITKYDASQVTFTDNTNVTITGSLSTAGASVGGTLAVSGAATFSGALNGTISTAAQPNITSVGTLSSLAVSGNAAFDTNTLFVDAANNRVGVGTTSSAAKFGVKLSTATSVNTVALSTGFDSTYAVFGNPDEVSGQSYAIGVRNTLDGINLISLSPTADWVDTNHYSRNHIFYGGEIEKMRIYSGGDISFRDSSANEAFYWDASAASLGIGTNSPSKLSFLETQLSVESTQDAGIHIVGNRAGADGGVGYLTFINNASTVTSSNKRIAGITAARDGDDEAGNLQFYTSTSSGALPERMRIDSSGTVQVRSGNELRAYRSDNTRYITLYNDGDNATIAASFDPILLSTPSLIQFNAGDTERMRITSGGYLKASNNGTYRDVSGAFHEMRSSAADYISVETNSSGVPYGTYIFFETAVNNTTNEFLRLSDVSSPRCIIRSNGGIANYQANDVNLSDERVKTDILPLGSYWDKIKAIEIVNFKYKDQSHDDFNIGVIAQQVESVAPEFVDADGFDNKPKVISEEVLDEEGNVIQEAVYEEPLAEPLKAVYTADLYHAAIKVLQEAMARIEVLETELNALKQA